ncbi:MAG TPA: TolC family protein [Candidatus Eremiobacteraceae bacterium]
MILAGLVLAAAVGTLPSPQPMSLDQAVAFAMTHNAAVLAAKVSFAAAGATVAANRAAGLPNMNAQAQSVLNRQSTSNAGQFAQFGLSPSPNFSQSTTQLQAGQNIFDLTTTLQARDAQRAYDAARHNFRLAQETTKLDVETSFYGLAESAQLVALAHSDTAYQQSLVSIAQVNYSTGKVAGIDVLKARIGLTSSQESGASAEADEADAKENLAQLIGAPAMQQFAVPDTIPVPDPPAGDLASLTARALRDRPDVLAAFDSYSQALVERSLVDAPDRPVINLSGAWGNQVSPTNNVAILAACNNPGRPLGEPPCGLGPSHFYTVSLTSTWTLPLLDWGSKHAARSSASVAADEKLTAYDAAKQQALIDVDQAFRRLSVDRQNLALATDNDKLAKQSADVSKVQYRTGLISQIDVTAAEQTYLQTAKDLLTAQVGYVLSVEKLKLAIGAL